MHADKYALFHWGQGAHFAPEYFSCPWLVVPHVHHVEQMCYGLPCCGPVLAVQHAPVFRRVQQHALKILAGKQQLLPRKILVHLRKLAVIVALAHAQVHVAVGKTLDDGGHHV